MAFDRGQRDGVFNDGIVSKRESGPAQNFTVPELLSFVFMTEYLTEAT